MNKGQESTQQCDENSVKRPQAGLLQRNEDKLWTQKQNAMTNVNFIEVNAVDIVSND